MTITVWVRREDYAPASSWRLLEWCLARGGDQFGLAFLGPPEPPADAWSHVDTALAPFALRPPPKLDPRYALSAASIAALSGLMTSGLFTYEPGLTSLEDPTVFRRGTPLLSIISHENEGVFDIAPDEQVMLDVAGLPYHLKSRWS